MVLITAAGSKQKQKKTGITARLQKDEGVLPFLFPLFQKNFSTMFIEDVCISLSVLKVDEVVTPQY